MRKRKGRATSTYHVLPPELRQISDPSYERTQTSPLTISPQLFHSKPAASIWFKIWGIVDPGKKYRFSREKFHSIFQGNIPICLCKLTKNSDFFRSEERRVGK